MPKQGDQFRIRRATLSDLNSLVDQRRKMWEDLGHGERSIMDAGDRKYRVWARDRLRNGTFLGWVAENVKGRIVGGGCLWLAPVQPRPWLKKRRQPYLLSMYTDPSFRGKGVALRIVEEAVKWSRANGYSWVSLHASEFGRGIYRRLGFKRMWEMRLDL